MQHHAKDERTELCSTLRAAGPGAPTLCGDWTTTELAAHLVLRERSIVEMAGRLPVRQLRANAERAIAEYAAREPYERIVDAIESGPPIYSPWAVPPLREAVNLLEYLVHHEDVRRAGEPMPSRLVPIARQRAIWQRLRGSVLLTMRAVPLGVRLIWPSHGEISTLRARRGGAAVTVTGDPVELALFSFGRQPVAQVSYDGAPSDVERVRGARITI